MYLFQPKSGNTENSKAILQMLSIIRFACKSEQIVNLIIFVNKSFNVLNKCSYLFPIYEVILPCILISVFGFLVDGRLLVVYHSLQPLMTIFPPTQQPMLQTRIFDILKDSKQLQQICCMQCILNNGVSNILIKYNLRKALLS